MADREGRGRCDRPDPCSRPGGDAGDTAEGSGPRDSDQRRQFDVLQHVQRLGDLRRRDHLYEHLLGLPDVQQWDADVYEHVRQLPDVYTGAGDLHEHLFRLSHVHRGTHLHDHVYGVPHLYRSADGVRADVRRLSDVRVGRESDGVRTVHVQPIPDVQWPGPWVFSHRPELPDVQRDRRDPMHEHLQLRIAAVPDMRHDLLAIPHL